LAQLRALATHSASASHGTSGDGETR
jgi:hypothetical protein